MSIIPSAQTAIGAEIAPTKDNEPEFRTPRRETFRRVCQHYVTNNNASSAPTVTVRANSAGVVETPINFGSNYYADFQQGFYNIPFLNTNLAVDRANWDVIQLDGSRFRIIDCGFEIQSIQCSQQVVTASASTTQVTNQFTQAPKMMLVKDTDHTLASYGTVSDPSVVPIMDCGALHRQPGTANKSFVQSFSAGELPKVHWLIPCSAGTISLNAETSFDLLKCGDVKWLTTGHTYKYLWTNPDPMRWFPCLQMNNDQSLDDEQQVLTSYASPTSTTSVVSAIMQNLGTDVNRNLVDIPVTHVIRVPPLVTQIEHVTITIELLIEYRMTIEWIPGRYVTSRDILGGVNTSVLPTQMIPFPEFRRTLFAFGGSNFPAPTFKQAKAKFKAQAQKAAIADKENMEDDDRQSAKRRQDEQRVPATADKRRRPVYEDQHDGRRVRITQEFTVSDDESNQ